MLSKSKIIEMLDKAIETLTVIKIYCKDHKANLSAAEIEEAIKEFEIIKERMPKWPDIEKKSSLN